MTPRATDKTLRVARSFAYPKQILYLIASFIALVSLCHIISVAFRYATRKRVYSGKRASASVSRLPIALVDSIQALTMRWTIHLGSSYMFNFAEVGVVIGYMGVLFSWTFVNTTTLEGQKVEAHYYANRAGTIAASQLPIVIALGMKNNIISSLTGIGFEKVITFCSHLIHLTLPQLNFLHRMSARTLVILIWIHGGGRCGFLAASSLSLLCILSIRPVREKSYELFLIIHLTLPCNMTYYGSWPSLIVWGLDRLISMGKIVIANFSYFNPWSKSSKELDATVEVLSHHFLKVTLHRSKYFYWRPGQSAYLSFPTGGNKLTFFLRVRKGFTARLMQAASQESTYKAFINGPYSSPPILIGYQSIMLFAGGSGISFTLPLFLSVINQAKRNKLNCRRVTFVWAIRDPDQVKWIEDVLSSAIKDLPNSIFVAIKLYVTAVLGNSEGFEEGDPSTDDLEGEKVPSTPSSQYGSRLLESPLTSLNQGRPDLDALIKNEIEADIGPISINVCGSQSLAEAVRRSVRVPRPMDVLRGGPTISLHIEPFGV
ncbi:ferric reductase NAD binding domain-containing protein [Gymnopilus junonius]|uniref:Ferric reductase NAD binding domain-containing protein n=1 Tax=Gymnopilus junonius TaxID=109634 RepID=A0A9P5TNS8_GYMJU|nr:ferric reductase NAD binding domain-containing protein [Gymnopilus junonius]